MANNVKMHGDSGKTLEQAHGFANIINKTAPAFRKSVTNILDLTGKFNVSEKAHLEVDDERQHQRDLNKIKFFGQNPCSVSFNIDKLKKNLLSTINSKYDSKTEKKLYDIDISLQKEAINKLLLEGELMHKEYMKNKIYHQMVQDRHNQEVELSKILDRFKDKPLLFSEELSQTYNPYRWSYSDFKETDFYDSDLKIFKKLNEGHGKKELSISNKYYEEDGKYYLVKIKKYLSTIEMRREPDIREKFIDVKLEEVEFGSILDIINKRPSSNEYRKGILEEYDKIKNIQKSINNV